MLHRETTTGLFGTQRVKKRGGLRCVTYLSVVVGGGLLFSDFPRLGYAHTYTHTYAISTHIQKKRRTRRYRWPPSWVSIQYLCISGSVLFFFLFPSITPCCFFFLPSTRSAVVVRRSFLFPSHAHIHTHTHFPWGCCCCCCCCFCCSYLASTLLPPPPSPHLSFPLLLLVILRSFFFCFVFVCFLLYPTRPRHLPRPSNNHR